jgi:hypothetical protein
LATFPGQLVATDEDSVRVAKQTQKLLRESLRCSSAGLTADLERRSSGWCRLPGKQFHRLLVNLIPQILDQQYNYGLEITVWADEQVNQNGEKARRQWQIIKLTEMHACGARVEWSKFQSVPGRSMAWGIGLG